MKGESKWNDDIIIIDLSNIKDSIGHFPTYSEIRNIRGSDLLHVIQKHGGLNKFRKFFGYDPLHKENGFWSDSVIIEKLMKVKNDIGHFPTRKELIDVGRNDLYSAISRHGGILKFRKLLGDEPLRSPKGFWTDKTLIQDLSKIKSEIGHFPSQKELTYLGRTDLTTAISQHGGLNKFRKLFGYESIHKPDGHWSDNIIVNDLNPIISQLGHFPTQPELKSMKRYDLASAINNQGGSNKFRTLMGYEFIKKPNGFWSDKIMVQELLKIKIDIGHFPTNDELIDNGHSDLTTQISQHGGINKFRELCGEHPSLYQKYRSESASYTNKRGRKTENFVKSILQDWCLQNNYPEPSYNQKISKSNIIEFVCNTNKKIGIDVTNTTTKYAITTKYRHKQYHLHLDELWIVVFSDVFIEQDYIKWNQKSPHNVRVMSIDTFLNELDYSLDEMSRDKMDKLCKCTFHTKEELKIGNIKYNNIL
jgi:hypothetical protein